jgi:hypothetical protein
VLATARNGFGNHFLRAVHLVQRLSVPSLRYLWLRSALTLLWKTVQSRSELKLPYERLPSKGP